VLYLLMFTLLVKAAEFHEYFIIRKYVQPIDFLKNRTEAVGLSCLAFLLIYRAIRGAFSRIHFLSVSAALLLIYNFILRSRTISVGYPPVQEAGAFAVVISL